MADIENNIKVNIDTSEALAQLKLLQQQISAFQQAMRNAGAANAQAAAQMQQNLVNSINATGKFRANIQTIKTSAESFTEALEKNKMSIGEYFRYAGGASKTFGKLFKSEFATIQQVAEERVKTLQTQFIKLGRDANGAMKAISVRPLALDMDSLSVKTQMAAQRQQLFNQLMKQGSTQLLNFGKNTQWAGRQLMVGFTVPLTMMGAAASKAYMEIEAASIKFKRVYGDMNTTTTETNKMVKSVQALAGEFTKYGLAVADTMDMAASAAAMGKTGADLLAQINQAAKLSVLGGVDQQKALETTISLTNAFGVASKDLGTSIDFLNAVENQTVLSIEDLTIAIPKAAPVVQQLGGDVKDLAFFLTAMKEGGINASEGANAIKSGLASLINPTDKASKFLAGFGINVRGIVESDKGNLKKTVIDFARALDTLDPLNRARAIEQMFGKFQFARISTLFKNVIDQGSQASQVASLSKQTAEELAVLSEREMKKVSDSPMFKFQKSIKDMQAKLAPIGEAFLKAVTPIVEFVSKILDGFNNLGEGSKKFITILVTAVAGIGPVLLMAFGLLSNGIANIMKLFTNIKSVINKSTKPSDLLGEQTQYMNSEQLKAAAVAASLDQAHSKLKQTFDSERTAIEQLTKAYRDAVQAQQGYAGVAGVPVGNPGITPPKTSGTTPKKYADGVHTVPGPAGAGDIVPALLSPGEAVIPAKQAAKYRPVISGMIAGNLPGFNKGTTGAGLTLAEKMQGMSQSKIRDMLSIEDTHITLDLKTKNPDVIKQIRQVYPNITEKDLEYQSARSNLTAQMPANVNQRMRRGVKNKLSGSVFGNVWNGLTHKLSKINAMNPSLKAVDLQAVENEIGRKAAQLSIVDDTEIGKLVEDFLSKNLTSDKDPNGVIRALWDQAQRVGTMRTDLKGPNGTMSVTDALIQQLKLGVASWRQTGGGGWDIQNASKTQRIGSFAIEQIASGSGYSREQKDELRKVARAAAEQWIRAGNWDAPLPIVKSKPEAGADVYKLDKNGMPRISKDTGQPMLASGWKQLSLTSLDAPAGTFSEKRKKSEGILGKFVAYDDAALKSAPQLAIGFTPGREQSLYETLMQNGLVSPTKLKDWTDLASRKFAKGTEGVSKSVVAAFGAHQPFTSAHERIARFGMQLAAQQGIPFRQFSTMQGKSKRSILSDELRSRLISESIGITPDITRDPFTLMETLSQQGVKKLTLLLGQDRMASEVFDVAAEKYGIKLDKVGIPREAGGVSGTAARLAAGNKDWKSFLGLIAPSATQATKHEVFKELSQSVGVKKFAYGGWGDPRLNAPKYESEAQKAHKAKMAAEQAARDATPEGQARIAARKAAYKKTLDHVFLYDPKIAGPLTEDSAVVQSMLRDQRRGQIMFVTEKTPVAFAGSKDYFMLRRLGLGASSSNWGVVHPDKVKSLGDHKNVNVYGSKGGIIRRYADGVFSVPGPKGAGDIIPAMLSPGEAVIPADKAAQHRGLISSMIAGKLPGYVHGDENVGKKNSAPPPIPGVKAPEPYVAPEPSKTAKFFDGVKDAVAKGAKKIGEAAEVAVGGAITRALGNDQENVRTSSGKAVSAKAKEMDAIKRKVDLELQANAEYQKLAKELKDSHGAVNSKTIALTKKLEEITKATTKRIEATYPTKTKTSSSSSSSTKPEGAVWKAGGAGGGGKWVDPETGKEMKPEGKFVKGVKGLFTRNEFTGKALGAGYGAMGILGAASAMPNFVGQAAQQILPAVSAATTAMQMIPGPAGMVVGGLAAAATVVMQVIANMNKARDEAYKTAQSLGAGNKALSKYAEFAKTVSGTEAMNKKREGSAGQYFNIVPGKKTFGESYMETDAGKQLVKTVSEEIKNGGGLKSAEDLITTQLSTAIASGVLTAAQARSIATNLGAQLKSNKFAINVSGRMLDIFGPNGENLKRDPLKINVELSKKSAADFKQTATALSEQMSGVFVKGVEQTDKVMGGWANFVRGSIVGEIVALPFDIANAFTEAAKYGGYLEGSLQNMFEVQQQLVDSLDMAYQKRIAEAVAAGKTAEATKLQTQYLQEQQLLMEQNKKQTEDTVKLLGTIDANLLGQAKIASEDAITKAYEGSGQEAMAEIAKTTIQKMSGNDVQKTLLNSAVASKQIGLGQVQTASSVFGQTQEGADQLQQLITNAGATEANRSLGLAANLAPSERKQFLVDISLADPAKTKLVNDALELSQKTIGVFGGEPLTAKAILDYSITHEDEMLKFKANIDALKQEKTITLTVVQKVLGKDFGKLFKSEGFQKYFKTYGNNVDRVTFIAELQQLMKMKGDPQMVASFRKWQSEGNSGTITDYMLYQADRTVKNYSQDIGTGAKDQGGPAAEPNPSFLDPYVQTLREAANLPQGLTVGWNASLSALRKYSANSIMAFSGQAVLLKQAGASDGLIQAFLGGSEEDQNKMFGRFKGAISKAGRDVIAVTKLVEKAKIGMDYILAGTYGQLEKKNELYTAGIEVISHKEKKVNEKYDARIRTLDEIGKLQERNNQHEQDTLDIADALSKGDIAGAARAAMKMRQDNQRQALEDSRTAVENARKQELATITTHILGETKTRKQLEEEIETNAARLALHKKGELDSQVQIGIHAQKTADKVAETLNHYKNFSKIKLPTMKVGNINGNNLNVNNVNAQNGPTPDKNPDKSKTIKQIKSGLANATSLTAMGSTLSGFVQNIAGQLASGDAAEKEKARLTADVKATQGAVTNFKSTYGGQYGTDFDYKKLTSTQKGEYDKLLAKQEAAKSALGDFSADAYEGDLLAKLQANLPQEVLAAYQKLKDYRESPERTTLSDKVKNIINDVNTIAVKNGDIFKGDPNTLKKRNTYSPDDQTKVTAFLGDLAKAKAALAEYDSKVSGIEKALADKGYNKQFRKVLSGYATGGMVYASNGLSIDSSKYALGTDTIPAMLTPGEFVMSKSAVDRIGSQTLSAMNNNTATTTSDSVYNYSITVNATSSDASGIADAVLREIKRIDSQRLRSNY